MNQLQSFFRGLRGKLVLTYTLVTVLALLAMEILILAALLIINSLLHNDNRDYLTDIVNTLGPQASKFLQPGKQDQPGLQNWLEQVHLAGKASGPPAYILDSPAADIVQSRPMVVLSPDGKPLARSPAPDTGQNIIDMQSDFPGSQKIIRYVLAGENDSLHMFTTDSDGNYLLAVPVHQSGRLSDVLAVILLTVRPSPPILPQVILTFAAWVLGTGIILLMAVAPIAALFGFIMSRGLTRRLTALTRAADAWSEGDFQPLPTDHSSDEIGYLSVRLRNMAERLQALLLSQQQLAMIEERNRLARELHDTVKQQTFATLMQVRAARNLIESDPDTARQRLEEAEQLIKTSQQDLQQIIAELRPAALGPAGMEDQGLAVAIQDYIDTWSKYARIPAALNVLNERRLPLEIEQTLYRVVQEALSNVARHSSASSVTLRLAYEPRQVCLTVADNGLGFDPASAIQNGYGLQSMNERLTAVGGQLAIDSISGSGTRLTVTIPIQ